MTPTKDGYYWQLIEDKPPIVVELLAGWLYTQHGCVSVETALKYQGARLIGPLQPPTENGINIGDKVRKRKPDKRCLQDTLPGNVLAVERRVNGTSRDMRLCAHIEWIMQDGRAWGRSWVRCDKLEVVTE